MRSILAWKHRTLGEIMVIGGVELYVMTLPLCERNLLTEVHTELSGGTWFPDYDTGERERDRIDHPPDPANRYPYIFVVLGARGPGAGPIAPRVKRPSLRRTITGTLALPWRSRCTGAFPRLIC